MWDTNRRFTDSLIKDFFYNGEVLTGRIEKENNLNLSTVMTEIEQSFSEKLDPVYHLQYGTEKDWRRGIIAFALLREEEKKEANIRYIQHHELIILTYNYKEGEMRLEGVVIDKINIPNGCSCNRLFRNLKITSDKVIYEKYSTIKNQMELKEVIL